MKQKLLCRVNWALNSQPVVHNLGLPPHCVSSFTAPETGAGDCEPGASSGASSAWRNHSDLRSQLRFVGEAIWYVDGIQLVKDGNHTAHLWLSAWGQMWHPDADRRVDRHMKQQKDRRN